MEKIKDYTQEELLESIEKVIGFTPDHVVILIGKNDENGDIDMYSTFSGKTIAVGEMIFGAVDHYRSQYPEHMAILLSQRVLR